MSVAADDQAGRVAARPPALGGGAWAALLGAYSVGGFVDSICGFFLTSLLFFYLTAVCGLSGAAAGASLAAALIVDSVVDPLVGSISDNSRSSFGRRHPFMIGAAIPMMVSLAALFSIPPGLKGDGLFCYATGLCLTLRIAMSCFFVPYVALGAELSDDYHRRTSIVVARFGVGTVGSLAPIILAYGVFLKGPGALLNRAAYAPLAWSCGAIVASAALIAGFGTLRARAQLRLTGPKSPTNLFTFFAELNEVRRNATFMALFLANLIFNVASGMSAAMQIHAATYFWKLPVSAIQAIAFAAIFGLILGLPIVQLASRVFEKRTIVFAGLLFFITAQVAPVLLRLQGADIASDRNAERLLVVATALIAIGVTSVIVGVQSMMADATDEHEHRFNSRREGLYFAGLSFSQKASSGLGVLFAGLGMDAIGFPHDLAAHHAAVQIPLATIRDLGLLIGPGTGALSLLGGALLLGYRLNRKTHARILEDLAGRRAGAATGQGPA